MAFDPHRAEWAVQPVQPLASTHLDGWRFRGDGVAIYVTPELVGPDDPAAGTRTVELHCEFCGREIEVVGVDGPDGKVICSGTFGERHPPALMRHG